MSDNPFTSEIFVSIWSAHFCSKRCDIKFNFIKNLSFYKPTILPFLVNSGKNLSKGISYSLDDTNGGNLGKHVFLIYDVPTYFKINVPIQVENLKLKGVKQYPGFLIELSGFEDFNDYLVSTFRKSSRYKLKKYKKRLEHCFAIDYKMFYGSISKIEYDFIFKYFRLLLEKRFSSKRITNNNLNPKEWNFYYEVAYPMIKEKKASLFVIYDGQKPIGITLNYFSDNIVFDAITVFDIDYSKFHLGSVTIMKLVEWCLEQKFEILDFSKGYFDYKKRWSNKVYDFEYHILYNSKSMWARLIALIVKKYFETKQYLREKRINEKLHKLTFWMAKKPNHRKPKVEFEFLEIEKDHTKEELVKVDWNTSENHFLKTPVFDFLYLNNETFENLQMFRVISKNSAYLFQGKNKSLEMRIKPFKS